MADESKEALLWPDLLHDTLVAFGEDSFVHKDGWAVQCDPLRKKLRQLLLDETIRTDAWTAPRIWKRLNIASHGWELPQSCATAILYPDDDWFIRESKFWHQPPSGQYHGPFYIHATLYAAVPASTSGYYIPPSVSLDLHVCYEMCAPFRWLLREWHRPLVHMLGWCKKEPQINDWGRPLLKGFRGKDALKKLSLYLEDPGDDPAFDLTFDITEKNTPDEITRAVAVFLAIWDALYSLTIPRCDPDRLHKHYLAMRSRLPNVPFRESFYNPGIELPL